jgi:hypothetical protein
MNARRASRLLGLVPCAAPLRGRELSAAAADPETLEWQGPVRLDPERAPHASASLWQAQVRRGLLERLLSLGADHLAGPHVFRPEVAERLLAHLDALGEAGCSAEELTSFALEQDVGDVGTPWVLGLLFGTLDLSELPEALESWVSGVDAASLPSYALVVELARSLGAAPNPAVLGLLRGWLTSPHPLCRAVALEARALRELSEDQLADAARFDHPLVWTALERLPLRAPADPTPRAPRLPRWTDLPPHLADEVTRARLARGDDEPLLRVRSSDPEALTALGPFAMRLLALAGDGRDDALAAELARALPNTAPLLDTLGLLGLPSILPRLLGSLDDEDLGEDAHSALVTALGEHVTLPSPDLRAAWEQVISKLPTTASPQRLRAGRPYSAAAVLAELKRPDLSALAVEGRAAELFVLARRRLSLPWAALGPSLVSTLSELPSLLR